MRDESLHHQDAVLLRENMVLTMITAQRKYVPHLPTVQSATKTRIETCLRQAARHRRRRQLPSLVHSTFGYLVTVLIVSAGLSSQNHHSSVRMSAVFVPVQQQPFLATVRVGQAATAHHCSLRSSRFQWRWVSISFPQLFAFAPALSKYTHDFPFDMRHIQDVRDHISLFFVCKSGRKR
jgi:hypothetical protein